LHIGGVRTALFNWLFARQQGGEFILRIDDTDQQRNIQAALAPILAGFRWLGLDWDEGPEVGGPHAPYYQSQRTERYQEVVESLLERGAAYYDYSRPEEIEAERAAATQTGQAFVYSRRWMATSDLERNRWEAEGRQGVVRLKMPRDGELTIDDMIRGRVTFAWQREQDHVIQRQDGSCLYHLATVADDYDFRISHVIRAEEHLSNTPRQIFIAQALGYPLPKYAHLPQVAEPGSRVKLSKRKLDKYLKNPDFRMLHDRGSQIAQRLGLSTAAETFNPVVLDFYQQTGFLAAAVLNYLLLLGWSLDDKTEYFTKEQMIQYFSLDRVNKSPASFDPKKLLAFQQHYMSQMPVKQKVSWLVDILQQAGWIPRPAPCEIGPHVQAIAEAAQERIELAGDILAYPELFSGQPLDLDEAAWRKHLVQDSAAAELLAGFRQRMEEVSPFKARQLEDALREYVAQRGVKIGQIIHALRVSITGKTVGFGIFETMEIVGRETCLDRIDQSLDRIGAETGDR
jgi:glutamyl-tRNA synthetase